MEQVKASRNTNGKYMRKYALTAKQKKILNAFGIDEKYIDSYIYEINKQI